MSSRSPTDLHPALQELWARLVPLARAKGIEIFLTCTWRPNSEQARLYAQGRTAPGMIVTNARPGQSAHNTQPPEGSHAFDFGVLVNGQYEQNDTRPYLAVAQLARQLGGECGAFWSGFKDYPHVQMPGWVPGKRYGPAFRFVPPVTPATIPATPPKSSPAPVPTSPAANLRSVVFRNAADDGWEAMKTTSAVYGAELITRLPGGDLQISGLLLTVNSDGDIFIKRSGGTP